MDLKFDTATLDAINGIYLVLFVFLVFAALIRMAGRFFRYTKEGQAIPLLLKRDFYFFAGLALPFAGVLFFRFFHIDARNATWYPIWILGSGTFAISAVVYWVWLEYFKIER